MLKEKKTHTKLKKIPINYCFLMKMYCNLQGMVIYCIPLYTSGILFIALLREYGESETKTSLVGAISSGLLGFAGTMVSVCLSVKPILISMMLNT